MTEKTTVIHNRIPLELDEFIERMAKEPEFHNKTHVVVVALSRLQELKEAHPVARVEAEDSQ